MKVHLQVTQDLPPRSPKMEQTPQGRKKEEKLSHSPSPMGAKCLGSHCLHPCLCMQALYALFPQKTEKSKWSKQKVFMGGKGPLTSGHPRVEGPGKVNQTILTKPCTFFSPAWKAFAKEVEPQWRKEVWLGTPKVSCCVRVSWPRQPLRPCPMLLVPFLKFTLPWVTIMWLFGMRLPPNF